MLVHKTPEGITFERESFSEYFVVRVSRRAKAFLPALPWYLVPADYDIPSDSDFYWLFPLFPFVKAFLALRKAWFFFPRYLYSHGPILGFILNPPQGVKPSPAWWKYIKRTK